ncbi:MAG: hypothetical protein IJG59_10710 [Erysipelotrichaceae bacterium]|nr:hypothetical protein [Erysipelotrichaceae bacterium]
MKSSVIVTVGSRNKEFPDYDMEIPLNVFAEKLLLDIVEAVCMYNSNVRITPEYRRIYCERLNRSLKNNETFGSAGIWNGDRIYI